MKIIKLSVLFGTIGVLAACAGTAMKSEKEMAPFGGEDSVA